MNDHAHDILKGVIGSLAPVVGVVTSFQQDLEWWLRITSLLIGCAVGIATLVSIYRKQ